MLKFIGKIFSNFFSHKTPKPSPLSRSAADLLKIIKKNNSQIILLVHIGGRNFLMVKDSDMKSKKIRVCGLEDKDIQELLDRGIMSLQYTVNSYIILDSQE